MRPAAATSLCFFLLCVMVQQSTAQSCSSETFSKNVLYTSCDTLPYLSSSLHWTYHASNGTVDIAFRATRSSDGWVGWAINPTSSTTMVGANAFLAFHDSTGAVTVYTTIISSTSPTIQDENLTFTVYSKQAEYSNGAYTIYATLELPSNSTKQNTLWQSSNLFQNGLPYGHNGGDDYLSLTSLDFLSGQSKVIGGVSSRQHRKNIHGVLNAISWGIMMPIGVIISRYMKVFPSADPAWFYLHITCQSTAYIIGISGWALGLVLGSESVGITYHKHRYIGIVLFCLATLQVSALLLRLNKKHKYRIYWNLYHWSVGYTVIILSVVNILKGFDILMPAKEWKHAYIGIIATLAGIALILEVITWSIVLKRRSRGSEKSHHDANGANGANRYGDRENQVV